MADDGIIYILGTELRDGDLVWITGRWTRLYNITPTDDGTHFRAHTTDGSDLLARASSEYAVRHRLGHTDDECPSPCCVDTHAVAVEWHVSPQTGRMVTIPPRDDDEELPAGYHRDENGDVVRDVRP